VKIKWNISLKMLKRPSKRVKPNFTNDGIHLNPKPITFLHGILNTYTETVYAKFTKGSVYNESIYLRMLEHNNKQLGVSHVQPNLPKRTPYINPIRTIEPVLDVPDRVYLKLKILKSGVVRIKLDTVFATLYEQWYQKNEFPPMKNVLNAYKIHGFSVKFLEKIKKTYERKKMHQKRIIKVFDSIFNKEVIKRQKKKEKEKEKEQEKEKEKEKDDEIERLALEDPEEEEEDNDIPEDEVDLEEEEEEVVEDVEEEYLSD
jgi:hypothetical protein